MTRAKFLVLFMLVFFAISSASAAHYIAGYAGDALDGTTANGMQVTLWNPSQGTQDNLTDVIGLTGNAGYENYYMIDCEMLSTPCNIGDVLSIEVMREGQYVASVVNVTVTGAGFDFANDLYLNSPPSVLAAFPSQGQTISNSEVNFTCNSSDLDGNLVDVTLYTNITGTWLEESQSISGSFNSAHFTKTITQNGDYAYLCKATDSYGISTNSTMKHFTETFVPPAISLISPSSGIGLSPGEINLVYNVTSNQAISSCSLIINGNVNATNSSVQANSISSFVYPLLSGKIDWNINCTDIYSEESSSAVNSLSAIVSPTFDGNTTQFNSINLTEIINLTLEDTNAGKITFVEPTNLEAGIDFTSIVNISHNFVSILTETDNRLNKSAVITLYGISLQKPVVLQNGIYCPECTVQSQSSNSIRFTVPHFTTYSVSENSILETWSSSDLVPVYAGQEGMKFYANYTDITNGQAISSATCNIKYNNSNNLMSYNASSKLFEYTSIALNGTNPYNISCYGDSSFASLSTVDYMVGASFTGPSHVSVNATSSSRLSADAATETNSALAGNVSELNIFGNAISQTWQGYYGNVTGGISLKDAAGNKLYDWTSISSASQVYASRSVNVDFLNIKCATQPEMLSEESTLGIDSTSVESIVNTFTETNPNSFSVGVTGFSAGVCSAVKLPTATSNYFEETLLSDSASKLVYSSTINKGQIGFNGKPSDFEMLVADNGKNGDNEITPYYFYIEVN